MNKLDIISKIRDKLSNNIPSIGSWMQIPNSSVAEIMGQSGYDWIALDMEHGSMSPQILPDIFRALELGGTLPMARLAQGSMKDIKEALDSGAGGLIIPMVESAKQLNDIIRYSCWPPTGKRGIAFSRANLYGKNFDNYLKEAQSPLLIAMIETKKGLNDLEKILSVKGLDGILIGPYDLSASLGITGNFNNKKFINAIKKILKLAKKFNIAAGIHIINPSIAELKLRMNEGYTFIAYSIDSVMLLENSLKIREIK